MDDDDLRLLRARRGRGHRSAIGMNMLARLLPQSPVSILFEQYLRERRMRVMQLFAESTFDVDNALKTWLEEVGPDRIRKARQ